MDKPRTPGNTRPTSRPSPGRPRRSAPLADAGREPQLRMPAVGPGVLPSRARPVSQRRTSTQPALFAAAARRAAVGVHGRLPRMPGHHCKEHAGRGRRVLSRSLRRARAGSRPAGSLLRASHRSSARHSQHLPSTGQPTGSAAGDDRRPMLAIKVAQFVRPCSASAPTVDGRIPCETSRDPGLKET
jgi:hypothetical protein